MSTTISYKKYQGELDSVDPVEYGINIRKSGKEYIDSDPLEEYTPQTEKDAEYLLDFSAKSQKGWRQEDRRLAEIETQKRINEFKQEIPQVGSEVYIEFESNLGNYFHYKIVYIANNKESVVGESLEERDKGMLRVFGFPEGFVNFHYEKP